MAFVQIKNLLHKSIGLHVDTVGESSIDRAIGQRMTVTDCSNANEYYLMIRNNSEELGELIEEVVVPETWFFRNITPFEVLRENAVKIYVKETKSCDGKGPPFQLKILSAPCSSGEEPYSIAMALSESGLKNEDFHIDAIDISRRALKKAHHAIYGKHSFREPGMGLQDKFFEKVKSGFRLLPAIRDRVSFQQKNIFDSHVGISDEHYDIIFCRNLLIYFDRETQHNILNKLSTKLKCGGLLFVGHAEAGPIDKNIFTKLRVAKSFAFRKKLSGSDSKEEGLVDHHPMHKLKDIYDQLVKVTKKDIELSKKINNPKSSSENKINIQNARENNLSTINELINSGSLSDATHLCEELLKSQPENADAYYYLGLISNLQGNAGGAEALLKKAIYLSPNHHKALALSAVLADSRGDDDIARSLRRREQKARERNS